MRKLMCKFVVHSNDIPCIKGDIFGWIVSILPSHLQLDERATRRAGQTMYWKSDADCL